MTIRGLLAVNMLCAAPIFAQAPKDVLDGLRSSVPGERSAAIQEVAQQPHPSPQLLELVADALLDSSEEVRVAAAFALPRMVTGLGCAIDNLRECKPLAAVVTLPVKNYTVPPGYPDEAKRHGIEGTVVLQGLVTEKGTIERATALTGPNLLRDVALVAFRQWKYTPAERKGKAAPLAIVYPMRFQLR